MTLIFPIESLKVQKLDRPFTFAKMPMVNGIEEIHETLSNGFINKDVIDYFGTGILTRALTNPFFYFTINASAAQLEDLDRYITQIFFSYVEVFLDSLWFVKDNACHSLNCYIAIHDKSKFGIVNNYRMATSCTAEFNDVEFTSDELEAAAEIQGKLGKILDVKMDFSTLERY